MSKKQRKMINAGINTDPITLEVDPIDLVGNTRLQERIVKHIRIAYSSELQDTYSFGNQIGQGGFGTVISVVDRRTDKDWAMKIVNKIAVGNKIDTVYREIRILKMVNHPHIIYLDKIYESPRKIYMVLELCYSALSRVYREQKRFSEKDTRKIVNDLASAIAYLHKNDIVHRDLKLDNILVAQNPDDLSDKLFIKVSDFGLSIVKQGSGHENMLHDCCGTPVYMAPEIIIAHSYSQQCDVWAIGVITYTLLAGHYPFYSDNDKDLTTMICKQEPTYSRISASTEAIHLITKMLIKNPALRITAYELINHPWILGKPMPRDSSSLENVLDMMRLWHSEMKLPSTTECDWVLQARALEGPPAKEPVAHKAPDETSEDSDNVVLQGKPQRQSMRLPVKNICFERPANQNASGRGTGRRVGPAVGVEEPRTNRRSFPSPISTPAASGRPGNAPPQRAAHAHDSFKSPDKTRTSSKQHG